MKFPRLPTSTLLAILLLAACTPPPPGPFASAPSYVAMTPPDQDAAGKRFEAPLFGFAAVYFVNPTTAAPVLDVTVDGREIGRLGTQTWMRAELAPGDHLVRCIGGGSSSALSVFLAPSEMRFLEIAMSPGQFACSVREVPAEEGRSGVQMGRRALHRQ